jgi:hypothetical protein
MRSTAFAVLTFLFLVTSPAIAADYCDRYRFGSPEWWNCTAQDRETGS